LEEETIALNILNLLFDAGEGLNRAGTRKKQADGDAQPVFCVRA